MKDFYNNFSSGITSEAYRYFGSFEKNGSVTFRVWAPGASAVSVAGDFNGWDETVTEYGRRKSRAPKSSTPINTP